MQPPGAPTTTEPRSRNLSQKQIIWQFTDLEISRIVGVSGLFRTTDDAEALQVRPDQIAMRLVVTGDDESKAALKAAGERLLARSREALGNRDDDAELPVARRRALMLDSASYRTAPSTVRPGMIEISVDVPADVQEQLEQGGGRAANLSLTLTDAMFAALKIRDGEATEPRAAELYGQVEDLLQSIAETPGADPPYTADDARAIAAAAVVVQAADGEYDTRALLPEAVSGLTSIANQTKPESESYRSGRDMSWDMGDNRSAATALPMVLLDDDLLAASGVARFDVAAAVERLATSTSREVHQRLTIGLAAIWGRGCEGDEAEQANHATAMTVYREWLMSAGIGPRNGQERPHRRLAEPLDAALHEPDLVFDVAVAVDALPGLKAASACDCEHGEAARATLGALVEHDLRAWPAEWARHRYHGSGAWREELDAWVAEQVLAGDAGLLRRYLDAFATVPEQLTGLLTGLADRAISSEQSQRLFEMWSDILDRLLPGARYVPGADDDRSYWRDNADLDKVLLPKRPDVAPWQGPAWGHILQRWIVAYAPQPSLCDRLMLCLRPFGHAISPEGCRLPR